MFKNINNTSKELGLAERIQPSAAEIYTQTNIPTGRTMPDYTQTQTSEKHMTFDSAEKARFEKEQDNRLLELLSFTPDERRIYFESFQKIFASEIRHHSIGLMLWVATTEHYKDASLTQADYDKKIREEQEILKAMDENLPVESYFRNGSDDTAKCGQLLIIKYKEWNDTKRMQATVLLSGIQWLIRERDKLVDAMASEQQEVKKGESAVSQHERLDEDTMPKDENEELAKVYIQLNLDDKNKLTAPDGNTYKHGKVLTAIMHMYQDEKKPWANNSSRFSKELVERLPETKNLSSGDKEKKSKAMARCMNREIENIKGLHLKNLSAEKIKEKTGCLESVAKEVYSQWEGIYPIVLNCKDNIRDKKKTEGDKEET